jgi:hypothetical protein
LRAALRLVRMPAPPGGVADARARLADILGRFTDGLRTPDLQEAAALLSGKT